MHTDRLLHLGCGLLALSLLLALVMAGGAVDLAAAVLGWWLTALTLLVGSGMLVGHLVVQALTREPTFEEQVSDWFE